MQGEPSPHDTCPPWSQGIQGTRAAAGTITVPMSTQSHSLGCAFSPVHAKQAAVPLGAACLSPL